MSDDLAAKGKVISERLTAKHGELGRDGTPEMPGAPQSDRYPALGDLPDDDYGREMEVPSPQAPLAVADAYIYNRFRAEDGVRTLVVWRGCWMRWRTTHWSELDTAQLRSHVYHTLRNAQYWHETKDGPELRPWNPDKHKVANVMEATGALAHLNADTDPPSWIGIHSAAETAVTQMISCENGLLDLSTRKMHDHTPAFFNVVSVPFDYQKDAPQPQTWLAFLASVWPDDGDSIMLLQEYIGYVLSGRTNMQKMLLLIGPTRSGKGTIARMLAGLVGRGHMAGPTLASLGTNFGLSPLLGKPLAVISDARLGNTPAHTVVERLLSITGEDMLTVDRKFKDPWSGKLPTRFVILSNELPKFRDSSMAIANRMLILQMTTSFLGVEDLQLDDKLQLELPGILNWALEGLDRLISNGKFTVPTSSQDAANLMMDLASPTSAFVRDRCVRRPGASVSKDRLYEVWRTWAETNGHHPGAKSTFGRDLRAVVPELKLTYPWVNGFRVHSYDMIGLQGCALNGDYACTTCTEHEHAGQDSDENGSPEPDLAPGHALQHQRTRATRDGAGWAAPHDAMKPQVNGHGAGSAGASALKAVREVDGQADSAANAAYRVGLCRDCHTRRHAPGRTRCDACHRAQQTR